MCDTDECSFLNILKCNLDSVNNTVTELVCDVLERNMELNKILHTFYTQLFN